MGAGCKGGVGTVRGCVVGGRSPVGDIGRADKDIAGAGRGVKFGSGSFSVLCVSVFGVG